MSPDDPFPRSLPINSLRRIVPLLVLIAAIHGNVMAELNLASVFSDHMVVQRDQPVRVWGRASANAEIAVSLAGAKTGAIADSAGKWNATLAALSPGGPHTLRVESKGEAITLDDVMIGDVYLCSGQSNMQWTVSAVNDDERACALDAASPSIRLFSLPKEGADTPRDEVPSRWRIADHDAIPAFSAVAFFFAAELRKSPALADVPIGLIDSSYGGTVVEAWISQPTLSSQFAGEELRDSFFGWKPSSMYNGMIHPVAPFPIRGVLWYQGESNAPWPEQYVPLLKGMIADWREKWQRPDLPFLIVQLPNMTQNFGGRHFTWLRESQARVAHETPNVHLAVAIDTADGYDLHPKEKFEIGRRLALIARQRLYGEQIESSGPVFRALHRDGATLRIQFDHADGGLVTPNGQPPHPFSVAATDGVFHYAQATIDDDTVLLKPPFPIPDSPLPAVRYAFEGNPGANLYNRAGLPARPFRTDDLPMLEIEVEALPAPMFAALNSAEVTVNGNGCLQSINIAGHEFLAWQPPLIRGGSFVTVWGPTELFHLRKTGPASIFAGNEAATILYTFTGDELRCNITNRAPEKAHFRFALAANVNTDHGPVPDALDTPSVTLRIDHARLAVGGIDRLLRDEKSRAPFLEINLAPGESRNVVLRPEPAGTTPK